jgi:hypothetical protein
MFGSTSAHRACLNLDACAAWFHFVAAQPLALYWHGAAPGSTKALCWAGNASDPASTQNAALGTAAARCHGSATLGLTLGCAVHELVLSAFGIDLHHSLTPWYGVAVLATIRSLSVTLRAFESTWNVFASELAHVLGGVTVVTAHLGHSL